MTGEDILRELFVRHPRIAVCEPDIREAFRLLLNCFRNGGKLLVCGNGGSCADADHLVAELMKGFRVRRALSPEFGSHLERAGSEDGTFLAGTLQGALPAISLSVHGALSTAIANDQAADVVFAQQVFGYGTEGDALLAFSTSGNSRNTILAAKTARAMGLAVIALTGRSGGALAPLCDVAIRVPEDETYRVQELHLPIYHAVAAALEAEIFSP